MLRSRRHIAAVGAIALLGAALPITSAQGGAPVPITVQMGLNVPNGFSTRALAPTEGKAATIRVHEGAIVNFKNGATLLPVGQGPLAWKADYASDIDSPFGPFDSDPDPDLTEPFPSQASYKLGPGFLGIPSECGAADNECVFSGANSDPVEGTLAGGDRGNFYVQIEAKPGETIWAVPGFGPVNMKTALRIQVVDPLATPTSQAAIDNAKAKLVELERDTAEALDAKLRKTRSKHVNAQGQTVWDAYAGFDTATIALLQMYPAKLVINKGDKIRWHFSQLQVEDHTVTFPFNYAKDLSENGFLPVCDPDGDEGEGPDEFTVDFETFSCPNVEDTLELDLTDEFVAKKGNGEFPGGKEHSGVRGANIPEAPLVPPTEAPFDLKFTDANMGDGYRYACAIHGTFMDGKVFVRP